MLLIQAADFALDFALANAGKSILANIAMMAITTKSSISVNARDDLVFISLQASILYWYFLLLIQQAKDQCKLALTELGA